MGYVLKLGQPALLIWVVRSYGKEAMGLFTAAESILLVSLRIGLVGFDKTLLWWVPRSDTSEGATNLRYLRSMLWLATGASVVVAVGVDLLAGFLAHSKGAPNSEHALRWMAMGLVPMTMMEVFIHGALGRKRLESHVMVRDGLVAVSFVLLALGAYYAGIPTDEGLAIAFLLSYVLGAIAAGSIFVKLYSWQGILGPLSWPSKELFRYALPIWWVELFNSFQQRLDVLALTAWSDLGTLGVYGVVVRVGNAVRSVRRSYDPIVTALMSEIVASGDKTRLVAGFSRATGLVMLTQIPIFAGLLIFADLLMPLFGPGFEQATLPVVVICMFWIVNGAIGLNGIIVIGYGRSDLILMSVVIMSVVEVALLWWLVPSMGAVGASIAVGGSYLFVSILQAAQAYSLSKTNPYNAEVFWIGVASLVAFAGAAAGYSIGAVAGELPARIASALFFVAFGTGFVFALRRRGLLYARDSSPGSRT